MLQTPYYSFVQFSKEKQSCPYLLPFYRPEDICFFLSARRPKTKLQLGIVEEESGYMQMLDTLVAGNQYVDLSAYNFPIKVGALFRLLIEYEGESYYSNLFHQIDSDKHTSVISYSLHEPSFGWSCPDNGKGENRIRLPFELLSPQVKQDQQIYTTRNGENILMYASVGKEHILDTDYLSQEEHLKLIVALSHDNVQINGADYTPDNDYSIDWENYQTGSCGKTAKASCTVVGSKVEHKVGKVCRPVDPLAKISYVGTWDSFNCLKGEEEAEFRWMSPAGRLEDYYFEQIGCQEYCLKLMLISTIKDSSKVVDFVINYSNIPGGITIHRDADSYYFTLLANFPANETAFDRHYYIELEQLGSGKLISAEITQKACEYTFVFDDSIYYYSTPQGAILSKEVENLYRVEFPIKEFGGYVFANVKSIYKGEYKNFYLVDTNCPDAECTTNYNISIYSIPDNTGKQEQKYNFTFEQEETGKRIELILIQAIPADTLFHFGGASDISRQKGYNYYTNCKADNVVVDVCSMKVNLSELLEFKVLKTNIPEPIKIEYNQFGRDGLGARVYTALPDNIEAEAKDYFVELMQNETDKLIKLNMQQMACPKDILSFINSICYSNGKRYEQNCESINNTTDLVFSVGEDEGWVNTYIASKGTGGNDLNVEFSKKDVRVKDCWLYSNALSFTIPKNSSLAEQLYKFEIKQDVTDKLICLTIIQAGIKMFAWQEDGRLSKFLNLEYLPEPQVIHLNVCSMDATTPLLDFQLAYTDLPNGSVLRLPNSNLVEIRLPANYSGKRIEYSLSLMQTNSKKMIYASILQHPFYTISPN